MKSLLRHSAALLGVALFVATPLAMAQHGPDVNWSVTIGSPAPARIYTPPPRVIYTQPAPVYVAPRVVEVRPAPVVYYQDYGPQPVYYVEQPRHYRQNHWKRRHRHDD